MNWKEFVAEKKGYLYGSPRKVLTGNPEVIRIIKAERGVVVE